MTIGGTAGTEHPRDARVACVGSLVAASPHPEPPSVEPQANRRSCDRCRKSKRRCEPHPDGGPVCERCARLGRDCTFLIPAKKRGRPRKNPSPTTDPNADAGRKRRRQLAPQPDPATAVVHSIVHGKEVAYCNVLFSGFNQVFQLIRPHMQAAILQNCTRPELQSAAISELPVALEIMTRIALAVGALAYNDMDTAELQMSVVHTLTPLLRHESTLEAAVCHGLMSFACWDGSGARGKAHVMAAREILQNTLGIEIKLASPASESGQDFALTGSVYAALMDSNGDERMRQRMQTFPLILRTVVPLIVNKFHEAEDNAVVRAISALLISIFGYENVDLSTWARSHPQFDSPVAYEELMATLSEVNMTLDPALFDGPTVDESMYEELVKRPPPQFAERRFGAESKPPAIVTLVALAHDLENAHEEMVAASLRFIKHLREDKFRGLWNMPVGGSCTIAWFAATYDEPEIILDLLPLLAPMPQRVCRALYCILAANYGGHGDPIPLPLPSSSFLEASQTPTSLLSAESEGSVGAQSPRWAPRETSDSPLLPREDHFWMDGLRGLAAMSVDSAIAPFGSATPVAEGLGDAWIEDVFS